jgi:hypothetical protein
MQFSHRGNIGAVFKRHDTMLIPIKGQIDPLFYHKERKELRD